MNVDKKLVIKVGAAGLGAVALVLFAKWWKGASVDDKPTYKPVIPPGTDFDMYTSEFTSDQKRAFKKALPLGAKKYGDFFLESGYAHGVSPIILAALMFKETGYGDLCKDAACKGSSGHDFGLMQINDIHKTFFRRKVNGRPAYEDPYSSIMYAGAVFRECLIAMGTPNKSGVVEVKADKASKYGCDFTGDLPDERPIFGELRIRAAIASYNSGAGNVAIVMACGLDPENATYKKAYVAGVMLEVERIYQEMLESIWSPSNI